MFKFFISVLRSTLAILISTIIVGGLIFFFFIALIGGITSLFEKAVPTVKDNTILVFDLSTSISDSPAERSPTEVLLEAFESEITSTNHLLEVLQALEKASEDSRIKGLLIKGSLFSLGYSSGFATINELSQALGKFKASGKPIIAYHTTASTKDYFLTSLSDKVVLNPLGQIALNGLGTEITYFADAFEKYGIGVQATVVGKFKSGIEPYTRNQMSPEESEQASELLADIWSNVVIRISENRDIAPKKIHAISDKIGLISAPQAKELGLIDHIAYEDQVFALFADKDEDSEDLKKLTLNKYISSTKKSQAGKSEIAIIYAEGDIVDGMGRTYEVGGDRLAKRIKKITEDDDVKAVVLRINSPGGGVIGAQKIQRHMRLLGKKKPVVASFGSYAASGGYWIASGADYIFADPMTITGSIGVYGLMFNIGEIAKEHGVTFDSVTTSRFANIFSISKAKSEQELAIFQKRLEIMYESFLDRVTDGRKLSPAEVNRVAAGRVWSGIAALENRLVDQLGGLQDAVKYAAKLADITDYKIKQVPEAESFKYNLLKLLQDKEESESTTDPLVSQFADLRHQLQVLTSFNDPTGTYARLPFTYSFN